MPRWLGAFRPHEGDDPGDYWRGLLAATLIMLFVVGVAVWVTFQL